MKQYGLNQAIITRLTEYNRITATCESDSITSEYNHTQDLFENHLRVAEMLKEKLDIDNYQLIAGTLPDLAGYAFCFLKIEKRHDHEK